MSEVTLFLVALGIAMMMAALASAGVHPNLMAAVRTTAVLVLSWSVASANRPPKPLEEFSGYVWTMLILTLVSITLAWCLYFQGRKKPKTSNATLADRINVWIAALFAILLVSGGFTSVPIAFLIIIGALILASNRH